MFLDKTVFFQSAPRVSGKQLEMAAGELNSGGRGQLCDGLASHPGESTNISTRLMLAETGKKSPALYADRLDGI